MLVRHFGERVLKMSSHEFVYVSIDGVHQCPIDWTMPYRWPSLVTVPLTTFSNFCKGPPQGPLVGPWGFAPGRFNYKITLICFSNTSTQIHHFPTNKTLLNKLRHTSTS